MLCDCHLAIQVWRFLRLDTNVAFYFGDLQHWLTDNIKSTRGMLFTATCWVIWKTCNAFIFGANTWSLWSIINQIQNLHMDIIKVWNHTPQHIRFVGWEAPTFPAIKLNIDGNSFENTGKAGFWGIFCHHMGNWILGFLGHCGKSTSHKAGAFCYTSWTTKSMG